MREPIHDRSLAAGRTILVLGPTAGGKSDLALELARRLDGEIVSADSMQVYRGMDVGTAKPTPADQALVRHHLIDLVDAHEEGFTVARWLALADSAIAGIRGRGRTPIVVGGTNLYVRAFLEGLDPAPARDPDFRASLASVDPAELHARLAAVDPAAAERLHPNDRRRIERALEIGRDEGGRASERRAAWSEDVVRPRRPDLFTVILEWPVEAINRRINARVRTMIEAGLLDEVRTLVEGRGLSTQARAACGYAEFVAALDDMPPPDAPHAARRRAELVEGAAERTKIRSRRLAKQQRTWLRRFRALEPSIAIACEESQTAAWRADLVLARLAGRNLPT